MSAVRFRPWPPFNFIFFNSLQTFRLPLIASEGFYFATTLLFFVKFEHSSRL